MTQEKTFTLRTGRSVKVIGKSRINQHQVQIDTEIEVLIKEPKEDDFRPPIGSTHPKYWKLKKLDSEKTRELQIEYSGISAKQIRKALNEFESRITPNLQIVDHS
jgi:hypothetical protein